MTRSFLRMRRALPTLALLIAACGDPSGLGDGAEPITELPRALTSAELAVIEDANGFGFDLMRNVLERDVRPNVVLSPFSASMALGMTLNGAAGQTFDEMRATLGFDGLDQEEINAAYRGLMDLLGDLDPDARFEIANSVWAHMGFPFHASFTEAVQAAFDAVTHTRDFSDPATVDEINAWVEENTGGLIDEIVQQLDANLVMLLLNAIYFEAEWTTSFDPEDTRAAAFRRADGTEVQVDMMSLTNVELPLGDGPGYQAVELPYGGGAFTMLVLVPYADTPIVDVLADMDAAAWVALVDGLTETTVDQVSIPKLELDYDAFLNDALRAMGMDGAFRPGADFTRLSPEGNRLCIGFVRQKTFIEVDEAGTRAAAVTGVGIVETSFLGVIADRPYAFAIRERLSGTVLFLGMVGDPTAEDPGPEPYEQTCA